VQQRDDTGLHQIVVFRGVGKRRAAGTIHARCGAQEVTTP
jgi:hypothetical protein